jgi:quinol monooxygenase YgiN
MNTVTPEASDEVATIIGRFRAALPDATKPFALLVRFAAQPTGVERIEEAFAKAIPLTIAEAGCRCYHASREARHPSRFVVYERWRNLADLEAHLRTDYILELRATISELMIDTPEFHLLTPVGEN